jgi:nicotinamidase/pyrazinamidase
VKINRKTDVLLIVDFQNDFITGSLAVPGAEELVPLINECIKIFRTVILSRDRHKKDHPSFRAKGGPWPDHCVENTYGAEIHPGISWPLNVEVATIFKGMNQEAYSAFERTTLDIILKIIDTKRLFICGLATDYCVKATTLDAIEKTDTEVFLLTDVIKAVNINPDDGEQAIKKMADAGVKLITLNDLKE